MSGSCDKCGNNPCVCKMFEELNDYLGEADKLIDGGLRNFESEEEDENIIFNKDMEILILEGIIKDYQKCKTATEIKILNKKYLGDDEVTF